MLWRRAGFGRFLLPDLVFSDFITIMLHFIFFEYAQASITEVFETYGMGPSNPKPAFQICDQSILANGITVLVSRCVPMWSEYLFTLVYTHFLAILRVAINGYMACQWTI